MGYQPRMPRNPPPPKRKEEPNALTIFEIEQHIHILVLRKSAAKLREYIESHSDRKRAVRKIIEVKYQFSKCRAEVIAILTAMAKDPRRFKFRDTSMDTRMVLDDTAYKKMYFQIYNFSSNPNKINPKVYINSKEFLSDHEEQILFRVVRSLDTMRKNEYKLQEELQTLEEQKNVFETYQSEKLSS